MTLVNTSIGIAVFRKIGPLRIQEVVDFDDVVTCLPMVQEVLQGFREEATCRTSRAAKLALPIVEAPMVQSLIFEAADLYRAARRRGRSVRSSIDCLIAECAQRHDLAAWRRTDRPPRPSHPGYHALHDRKHGHDREERERRGGPAAVGGGGNPQHASHCGKEEHYVADHGPPDSPEVYPQRVVQQQLDAQKRAHEADLHIVEPGAAECWGAHDEHDKRDGQRELCPAHGVADLRLLTRRKTST